MDMRIRQGFTEKRGEAVAWGTDAADGNPEGEEDRGERQGKRVASVGKNSREAGSE